MTLYDTTLRSSPRFANLKPISVAEASSLREGIGDIPKDYVAFLCEVGAGTVGNASFRVYPGLIEPSDIYDPERASTLSDILLFGDDFQGYNFGFSKSNGWKVVEVSPTDGSIDITDDSFEDFVRSYLLSDIDEDGS